MFNLMPFGYGRRNNWLQDMDRSFDSLFRNFGFNQDLMRTDIEDKGDHYEMMAEMPGLNKEDIKLSLDGDRLTIHAVHSEEQNKNDKKKDYVCRERSYSEYQRSFDVSDIVKENIKASYENGILQLILPKKEITDVDDGTIQIEID